MFSFSSRLDSIIQLTKKLQQLTEIIKKNLMLFKNQLHKMYCLIKYTLQCPKKPNLVGLLLSLVHVNKIQYTFNMLYA